MIRALTVYLSIPVGAFGFALLLLAASGVPLNAWAIAVTCGVANIVTGALLTLGTTR